MKNEVRKLLLTCALFIGVMSLSAQLSQHGLVLNGGIGSVESKNVMYDVSSKKMEYKAGFSVGYRLRFSNFEPKSFHYDMDVNIGAKLLKPFTYFSTGGYATTGATPDYFTAIGGTANYSFIKNLSIGLGVEPTYYFNSKLPSSYKEISQDDETSYGGYNKNFEVRDGNERKSHFDIPLVAKVTYKFKAVEVGVYGKYGLGNVLGTKNLKTANYRDLQLSVFIPFKTK